MSTNRGREAAHRFLNDIRILYSIDRHELVAAGVLTANDAAGWQRFQDNPPRWALRAEDAAVDKLWALMESRQPQPKAADLPEPV